LEDLKLIPVDLVNFLGTIIATIIDLLGSVLVDAERKNCVLLILSGVGWGDFLAGTISIKLTVADRLSGTI
jgi:hypothetical protein